MTTPVRDHLDWPFFDDTHRALAVELDHFVATELAEPEDEPTSHEALEAHCRHLVRRLGAAGLLRWTVAGGHGAAPALEVRSLALARETLARASGLADFAFVMQGLGTGPISLFGTEAQRARVLPGVARGERIAALAMSEADAGSDVAAIATTARRDGEGWVLDGEKTWISNGAIADHLVVIARTGEAPGAKGLSAFVVDADTPGFSVAARIDVMAPHPLATLRFDGCRVGGDALLGQPGDGFRIAMGNLDVFRTTVGAAAVGFARRGLDEALARVRTRKMFGATLADFQLTQARLADMATSIDAAALLVYRAAWVKDRGAARVTREASMAKMYATEIAQQVVDGAVQLFGGLGVTRGQVVERLYREVRALRVYEGATEVNKLVIAGQLLRATAPG